LIFYHPLFSPFFRSCFVPFFFSHVVSSLAYPNLLENKRLSCCYCMLLVVELGLATYNLGPQQDLTLITFCF
jgi:hypothetical protein